MIARPIVPALALITLLASAPALAESGGTLYGAPGRSGFTAGVELGGGNLGCKRDNGCDGFVGAGSFGLHLGGMASDRLAALFDMWWMVHDENRETISQGIMTASLQLWPIRHLWLRGGLGAARLAYAYDGGLIDYEDHTEWVPAFQVGIGVEPIATRTFGLDIALRYGTGFYSDGDHAIHNGALTIGVSWY